MPTTYDTSPGKPKPRLSLRTRLFVEAYLSNGGNVAKATREAGYANEHAIGHRRLNDPARLRPPVAHQRVFSWRCGS
jgi:hypothetical protein